MKNRRKKPTLLRTVPKYNLKIVETETKLIVPTHIYMTAYFAGLVQVAKMTGINQLYEPNPTLMLK